jgi:hypothetical protein
MAQLTKDFTFASPALSPERLSMKSIRERLIQLIETAGQGGQFATPSGLKTLAGELGITHEALYRTISRLESDKVLRRDANQMVLIRSSAVGSS